METIDRARIVRDATVHTVTPFDLGVLSEHVAECVRLTAEVDPRRTASLLGGVRVLIVDGPWTIAHERTLLPVLDPGTLLVRQVPTFESALVGCRGSSTAVAAVIDTLRRHHSTPTPADIVAGAVFGAFWTHPGDAVELADVPR